MQIRTVSQEVDTLPWPQPSQARKPRLEPITRRHESVIPPLFDLAEHDDCYVLAIDLPGLPNPEARSSSSKAKFRWGPLLEWISIPSPRTFSFGVVLWAKRFGPSTTRVCFGSYCPRRKRCRI